jgi:hypothetical protein
MVVKYRGFHFKKCPRVAQGGVWWLAKMNLIQMSLGANAALAFMENIASM